MYRELLLLHIRLLCEYRKDDVIRYAKKKYYPLQECLEICRKYKANFATAYLLQRSGNYAESLDAYIGILTGTAERFFGSKKDYLSVSLEEYKKSYAQALKVCVKNAVVAGKEQTLWFLLLDHLYELWKRLCCAYPEAVGEKATLTSDDERSSSPVRRVVKTVYDCIKNLSAVLMQHTSFEDIIQHVTSKHGELEMENFRDMLSAMVITYLYQEKIFDVAKLIQGKSLTNQFGLLVRCSHKAVSIHDNVCAKCRKRVIALINDEFMAFPCGHIYHPGCLKEAKVCEYCLPHCTGNVPT